jgi:predicted nucleotidyltransferase
MKHLAPEKSIPNKNRDPFSKLKDRWHSQIENQKRRARQHQASLHNKGPELFQKYAIETAILFGSVLNGKCSSNSDIDLLLIPLTESDFWKIRYELEETLGCRIDLYSQSDDPQFIEKIKQRGKVIYAA